MPGSFTGQNSLKMHGKTIPDFQGTDSGIIFLPVCLALTNTQNAVEKAWSRFYKTEPVDYKNQDWFINVVVKVETTLAPFELLKALKSIERGAGRVDGSIRFGPRVLDLDIILYDDLVTNSSRSSSQNAQKTFCIKTNL